MSKAEKVKQTANELRARGYRVVQYAPWHLRVFKDRMACDLWPTANKLMLRDGFWSVKVYKKLFEELAAAFAQSEGPKELSAGEQKAIERNGDFRDELQAKLTSMGL